MGKRSYSKLLTGVGLGFSFFWLISNPKSKVKRKMPQKNFKNFHFSPNIRIVRKNKSYHFHHWFILMVFYLPILIRKRHLLRYKFLHGFILGSILQGLSFKDRFKIIYPLSG
ncbi:MAG: hypothetical protein M1324_01525 [Patescibacteria group bacterium]|nr:hypothetical protein [Patescibacteria group bacterium]